MSEIIIDGVDVSGCEYFEKHYYEDAYEDDCKVNIDNYCHLCWDKCENRNCSHKQLKRLEQENERLKGVLEEIMGYELNICKKCLNKYPSEDKYISRNFCKTVCKENYILDKINEVLG